MPQHNKLVELQIKEVSGVDAAANMRKFLVVKSAASGGSLKEKLLNIVKAYLPPKGDGAMTFSQAYAYEVLDEQVSNMMYDAQWALRDTIKSIMKDTTITDKMTHINNALSEFSQVVSSTLQNALNAIGTATPVATTKNKEGTTMPLNAEVLKGLPEDIRKELEELQKKANRAEELEKKVKELEKSKEGAEGSKEEDIYKGLPDAVREQVKKWEERVRKAEEIAKAEREARIKKEFIAKAAEFKGLNVQPEEFGSVLKAISENCPEQFEKLEAVLKAADQAIATGEIFKEYGSNGSEAGSAWSKITKAAEELCKKDSSLSKEQAINKVMEEQPELYEEYKKELAQ